MRDVVTWYWLNGQDRLNLGEHFVGLILPKLGCCPRPFDEARASGQMRPGEPCLLMIGSEFHATNVNRLVAAGCHVHVWGQGNGRSSDGYEPVDMREPHWRDHVTVHALRGPLTKRVSHVEEDVPLCDPGFLLPRFFPDVSLTTAPRTRCLYVPHHANRERVFGGVVTKIGVDAVLDVMMPSDQVLPALCRIASAEFVLTNSLHGFIAALAYQRPCAICLTVDETLNMPDKWRDLLESMEWSGNVLPVVGNFDEGRHWWETEGQHMVLPDCVRLLEVFPFAEGKP